MSAPLTAQAIKHSSRNSRCTLVLLDTRPVPPDAGTGNGTLEYALDNHPSATFPTCTIAEAAARREGCNAAGAGAEGQRLLALA